MTIVAQSLLEYKTINIITRHPNYDPANSYDFGEVIFFDHYYWKSITDANIGHEPFLDSPVWLMWDVSNRYAQIDLRATTTTTWDSSTATVPADNGLISTFDFNDIDTLALGNVRATSVTVRVVDSLGATVWESTQDIYNRVSGNPGWFSYFWAKKNTVLNKTNIYFQIPKVQGETVEVFVEASDGAASVGYMVGGNGDFTGYSQFGLSRSVNDNSLIDVDDWGITTIKKRIASRSTNVTVEFPSKQVMEKERIAMKYQGTIALFVADESTNSNYENLLLLAYIENYITPLNNPTITMASYSCKEVI